MSPNSLSHWQAFQRPMEKRDIISLQIVGQIVMIIEFYIYLAIVIGLVTIGMILACSLYNAFN